MTGYYLLKSILNLHWYYRACVLLKPQRIRSSLLEFYTCQPIINKLVVLIAHVRSNYVQFEFASNLWLKSSQQWKISKASFSLFAAVSAKFFTILDLYYLLNFYGFHCFRKIIWPFRIPLKVCRNFFLKSKFFQLFFINLIHGKASRKWREKKLKKEKSKILIYIFKIFVL